MMSFGPEWLRSNVSGGGGGGAVNVGGGTTANSTNGGGAPDSGGPPLKFQLAQYRYGREEMLALFYEHVKPPEDLKSRIEDEALFVEHVQKPMSYLTMTDEETRQWNRGVNCDLVLRGAGLGGAAPASGSGSLGGTQMGMGSGGGPLRGGRGAMSVDRGRGRGRGGANTGGFFYSRYDLDADGGDKGGINSFSRPHRSFSQVDRSWGERNGSGDPAEWNGGSTSPRKELKEFGGGSGGSGPGRSGGMENWRRGGGRNEDTEEGWRGQRDKWGGSRSSWRSGDDGGIESDTHAKGDSSNGLQKPGGGGRSSNWGRGWADEGRRTGGHEGERRGGGSGGGYSHDEVPEWATTDGNNDPSGGTFDASGAFHGCHSDEDEVSDLHKRAETKQNKEPPDSHNVKNVSKSSESGDGISRSKTVTDIPINSSNSSKKAVIKSQSSSVLTDAQTLQRIRSQHQNFVDTNPTNNNNNNNNINLINNNHSNNNNNISSVKSKTESEKLKSQTSKEPTPEVPRQASDDDITRLADSVVNSIIGDEEKPKVNDHDMWFYRDPQGVEQGPFRSSDMYEWFENGYFTNSLLVRRASSESFVQLGELRSAAGGAVPFASSQQQPPSSAVIVTPTAATAAAAVAPVTAVPSLVYGTAGQGVNAPPRGDSASFFMGSKASDYWSELTPAQRIQMGQHALINNASAINPLSQINQLSGAPMSNLITQLHAQRANPPVSDDSTSLSVQQFFQRISRGASVPQMGTPNFIPPAGMPVSSSPIPILPSTMNRQNSDHLKNDAIAELIMHMNPASMPQPPPSVDNLWSGPGRPQNWASNAAPSNTPPSFWDHDSGLILKPQDVEFQLKKEEEKLLTLKTERLKQVVEQKLKEREKLEQEKLRLEKERMELEERKRIEEERKRLEAEESLRVFLGIKAQSEENQVSQSNQLQKKRQEELERSKAEEENRMKVAEEQKKRIEEMKKANDALKKKEEKEKKKEEKRLAEEERKRQEAEKLRLDQETASAMEQEAARKRVLAAVAEEERSKQLQQEQQQRRQAEALRKLSEQQQQMKPRLKPWSQPTLAPPSLAEIQAQERENKKESQTLQMMQLLNHHQQQLQQQQELAMQQETQKQNGLNLKWAQITNSSKIPVKSLAEIQAEEQVKIMQQQEQERRERAERLRLQQQEIQLIPSGNIWSGGVPSLVSSSHTRSSTTAPWAAAAASQPRVPPAVTQGGFWDATGGAAANKSKVPAKNAAVAPPPSVTLPTNAVAAVKTNVANKKAATSTTNQKTGKSKSKKEEVPIMKMFDVQQKDEFTQWAISALNNLQANIDVPTFSVFLREVESPFEVKDYVRDYLGESREAQEFARQFIERRSRWKSQQRAAAAADDDDMCAPAAAINPVTANAAATSGASNGPAAGTVAAAASEDAKKGKKSKKGKMQRVDNRILGFNVTAAENRLNIGERDTWDPHS